MIHYYAKLYRSFIGVTQMGPATSDSDNCEFQGHTCTSISIYGHLSPDIVYAKRDPSFQMLGEQYFWLRIKTF